MQQALPFSGGAAGMPTAIYCSGGDLRCRFSPLLEMLRKVDFARLQLERSGGGLYSIKEYTALLNRPFVLPSPYGPRRACSLVEQKQLCHTVAEFSGYTARLDVRSLDSGLPVYYLCRTITDTYRDFSCIVQDLYRSPAFPHDDERFVRLRIAGREEIWLRMSQLREAASRELPTADPVALDRYLYSAGRTVLAAAWHDSQRPSLRAAQALGFSETVRVLELLYLAQTADPSILRAHVDESLLRFFTSVYDNSYIHDFLEALPALSGSQLDRIQNDAHTLYRALADLYRLFLKTEVEWGEMQSRIPLWKLIYGNYSRLHTFGEALKSDERVREAVAALEHWSSGIGGELLT